MKTASLLRIATVFPLFLSLITFTPSALAFEGHYRGGYHHEGHWVHDRHYGRLGWWWVAGPAWTFFARPYPRETVIVEAPQPTVTVVQTAPSTPAPIFYYCKATGNYYPDAMACPSGWTILSAKTPPDLGTKID